MHSLDAVHVVGGIHVHIHGSHVLLHRSIQPEERCFGCHATPSPCQLALRTGEASRTSISACLLGFDRGVRHSHRLEGQGHILCATCTKEGFSPEFARFPWVREAYPAEHPFGGCSSPPFLAGILLSAVSVRKGISVPIDRETFSQQISVFDRGSTCCNVDSFANERSTKQRAPTRIHCSKCSPTAHKRRRGPSGRP